MGHCMSRAVWLGLTVAAACGRPHGVERAGSVPDPTDREPRLVEYRVPVESLVGTAIIADPVIGRPSNLAISGSQLWISDRSGNPFLHVAYLDSAALSYSEGRAGEGPGDFHVVSSLSKRPGDDRGVWAFDEELRRMTRLTADSVGVATRELGTPSGRIVFDMQWLVKDRLIAVGDLDTNRFIIGDTAGRTVRIIPGHLLGPDSVGVEARRALSTGVLLCTAPASGRFAVVYVGAGRVELHDSTGGLIALADVPFRSDGAFWRARSGRWEMRTPWRFYAGCAFGTKFLYALFAGTRTDIPGSGIAVEAQYVHVFDRDGALEAVLRLDLPMSALVVSGDTVLYAAGSDDARVYRFRLPAIPDRASR